MAANAHVLAELLIAVPLNKEKYDQLVIYDGETRLLLEFIEPLYPLPEITAVVHDRVGFLVR